MKKIFIAMLLTATLVGCNKAETIYEANSKNLVGTIWQRSVVENVVKMLQFDTETTFTTWYAYEDGTPISTSISSEYRVSGKFIGEIESFNFGCTPFYLDQLGRDVVHISYEKGLLDSPRHELSICANLYKKDGKLDSVFDERFTRK